MPQVDQELLKRAKAMRGEMTEPETRLWLALRARRLNGIKFVRQPVRGRAIPDFVARSLKLIVEVDGDTHAGNEAYDARRTAVLEREGYRVLRFTNADVMTNLEGVLAAIVYATTAPLPTSAGSAMPRAWPKQHVLFTRHSPQGRGL